MSIDLNSFKMSVILKIFHLAVFVLYSKVLYQLCSTTNSTPQDPVHVQIMKKNMFRFLTNWTYIVQYVYFSSCILAHLLDLSPSLNTLRDKVKSFGNVIFTTIVIPVGLCVTIMFWGLYIVDKNGIYPDWVEKYLPAWLNHSLHTFNSILPLIDMYLVHHKFPTWSRGVTVIIIYLLAYNFCIVGTYIESGSWLYPFIETLTWPQRGILAISTFLTVVLSFGAAKVSSGLIWGKHEGKSTKSSSSKNSKHNRPKQKPKKVA